MRPFQPDPDWYHRTWCEPDLPRAPQRRRQPVQAVYGIVVLLLILAGTAFG